MLTKNKDQEDNKPVSTPSMVEMYVPGLSGSLLNKIWQLIGIRPKTMLLRKSMPLKYLVMPRETGKQYLYKQLVLTNLKGDMNLIKRQHVFNAVVAMGADRRYCNA